MVLGEQKHSYILVSVFAGGKGAGQETRRDTQTEMTYPSR